jgi:cell wall-associated NlpC family hydrolase
MGRRISLLLGLAMAVSIVTGCASTGTAPRPQPFPGARVGPAGQESADHAANADSGLLATALSLLGTPYRNGGSEPTAGFDCSGFVQWVFARHGTSLPRETREQYDRGHRVSASDVQPGDLVFFRTEGRQPSHVGIALGGGAFVHAPSSRGVVRVERYTSEYWASRWAGATRVPVPGSSRTD